MSDSADLPALGSISQEVRSKSLKSAKGILLFIGIITLAVNGLFFSMAEHNVDTEIEKELGGKPNAAVLANPEFQTLRSQAIRTTRLVNAAVS